MKIEDSDSNERLVILSSCLGVIVFIQCVMFVGIYFKIKKQNNKKQPSTGFTNQYARLASDPFLNK